MSRTRGAVGVVSSVVLAAAALYWGSRLTTLGLAHDRVAGKDATTGFAQGLAADGTCARAPFRIVRGAAYLPEITGGDSACPGEMAAFAVDQRVELLNPGWSRWRDSIHLSGGDLAPLSVVAYVASLPNATPDETELACKRAEADVARAHQLFNTMQCGIAIHGDVKPAKLTESYGLLYAGCNLAESLHDSLGYQPGVLNVYYIAGNGEKGLYCESAPDTLIVSTIAADNETLAHEVGHALTLDHFGDSSDNIMTSGTSIRDVFTLGQCFRCAYNPASPSRATPIKPAAACPTRDRDDRCPEVFWPAPAPAAPPQHQPAKPADIVKRWLECEECTSEDLQRVVALRDDAVTMLGQAFDSGTGTVRLHLQAVYDALRPYCDSRPGIALRLSRDEYVAGYLGNLRARHQLRAAIAAAQIRTAAANALLQLLRRTARRDVQRYITVILQ